MKKKNM